MNITEENKGRLQAIDLSTEAAVVEKYEALANSPLLISFLLPSCFNEAKAAYNAGGNNPEIILGVFRNKLRDYATTDRTRSKRSTIKAIRRRIGLLFAECEADEKAGGLPAKDWYLYAYAIERGFDPDGASLSETDTAALDEVAECIFNFIEKHLIYSLTGEETAVDSLFSHKLSDIIVLAEQDSLTKEADKQLSVLFADGWDNTGFVVEATRFAFDFLKALSTDVEIEAQLRKHESLFTADDIEAEEAASMKRAQGTKYNDYIKANTPC